MGAFTVSASSILDRARQLGSEAEGVELSDDDVLDILEGIDRSTLAELVRDYCENGNDAAIRVRSEDADTWADEFRAAVPRYI